MNKNNSRPARRACQAQSPEPAPAVPVTVLELGRLIRAADREYDQLDEAKFAKPRPAGFDEASIDRAMMLVLNRLDALSDLALTLPAQTIGDAAVQLALAQKTMDRIRNASLDDQGMDQALRNLRRVVCSTLPVVAAAAGIGLAEITDESAAAICAAEFASAPGTALEPANGEA